MENQARALPRLRWVAVGIVLLAYLVGVTVSIIQPEIPGAERSSVGERVGLYVAFGVFSATGALLIAKRPHNVIGWMLALVGVMPSVFSASEAYGGYVMTTTGRPDALTYLGFWANGWYWLLLIYLITVAIPTLFPDGRLPSPRWRWAFAVPTVSIATLMAMGMTQPVISGQDVHFSVPNPVGVSWMPSPEDDVGLLFLGLIFGIALAVAAIVVRFRRSHGATRQQLKVFLFAVALLPLLPLGEVVPFLGGGVVFSVLVSAIPVAITVGVLRYRLYDIDRVISRTVAYVILTSLLLGVYALGVLGVGALVPGERSDLLVAATTLLVASLVRPLRGRIQRMVDHRFNRSRYDAAGILEGFSSQLRDEVDLGSLRSQLRQVAVTTVQPRTATVWLRSETSHTG